MRGIASLLTLAAGLVLAAPAAAADHPISFANYAYNPADVTIAVNDTATFSGNFMSHPLAWDSGQFAPTTSGSSKQFAFAVPGTYTYYCQIHRDPPFNMRGVIRVAGNQHPAHVAFTVSPAAPAVGQTVTFTYTGYPDPDGTLVRWEWDLDGDGSFETSTATPTATRVYTAPGALTVRMRAVDNGNEPSAVVEQALTIAAADTTAPRATRVRLRGLTLSFRSSERATATATLRARGRTLARGTARAGRTTIKLRLTTAGRRVLVRGRRVRATLSLTLRDPARNARTTRRQMTVRRR